jgi:hypothetical protein
VVGRVTMDEIFLCFSLPVIIPPFLYVHTIWGRYSRLGHDRFSSDLCANSETCEPDFCFVWIYVLLTNLIFCYCWCGCASLIIIYSYTVSWTYTTLFIFCSWL